MDRIVVQWVVLGVAAWASVAQAQTAPAEVAQETRARGTVVFARGDITWLQPGAQPRLLRPGDEVSPGDELRSGTGAYAHIRFPDGGFVGLRPDSRFVVESYTTSGPDGVRVRFRLESGTVRSITGETVERHKQRFRMNTPVAALGVRGTDYVVRATNDSVHAIVNRGSIVVAPFGAGCDADSLGACDTDAARTLRASDVAAFIEFRRGQAAPRVRQGTGEAPVSSDNLEPHASAPLQEAPGREAAALVTSQAIARELNQPASEAPSPKPPDQVVWGRWSNVALSNPTVSDWRGQGYTNLFTHNLFGLLYLERPQVLPSHGVAAFTLDSAQAYLRDPGGTLSAVPVADGRLSLDFGARRFDTTLEITAAGLPATLGANGRVDRQGNFFGDASRSDMKVFGTVAGPQTDAAGYLFERAAGTAGVLYGATSWRR